MLQIIKDHCLRSRIRRIPAPFSGLLLCASAWLFPACTHTPAPSSYAARQPHVFTPYTVSEPRSHQNEEDLLTKSQLALLDPPNTMSLVGRAVESHRRAIEDEQRIREQALRKSSRKGGGRKLGKSPKAISPWESTDVPFRAVQADLSGLGLDCQGGYAGTNGMDTRLKSVLLQKNCLPKADGSSMKFASRSKAGIRFSGIKGNLWDVARKGLVLNAIDNDRLNAFLGYLRQKPETIDFLMGRAEPYLKYLLGELKSQGLPADLILVPMVESAFQTTAVSPKQAAGIWQFIASTGQQYGLKVSETYDGRYDTHLATQAALKYLSYLNGLFEGDWPLTLAAYNAGEGTVGRAISANRAAGGRGSFWELSLPEETRNYVLKIVALSRIVADPSGNGFSPRDAQASEGLTRVEINSGIKVQDLIVRSKMAAGEFFKLNPHVRPDVPIPPEAHNFMLPSNNAELLAGIPPATSRIPVMSQPVKSRAKRG